MLQISLILVLGTQFLYAQSDTLKSVLSIDVDTCYATFYADKFHGRKTSSGAIFSQQKLTAAHPSMRLGTKVRVTNLKNGKTVEVVVNDRKAKSKTICLDLSKKAAQILGFIKAGKTRVSYEIID